LVRAANQLSGDENEPGSYLKRYVRQRTVRLCEEKNNGRGWLSEEAAVARQ
jgi:hypothetical protein